MDTAAIRKNLPHLIAAVILIFVLLFVLTRFGYMRCSDVPGFCGIYYSIVGTPRIAIVGGTDGMGDPEALRGLIAERTGRFADLIPLDQLTAGGVLDNYQVIIVDKARKIDTATLKTFSNFVSRGGKLVWIGDAGTQLGSNDLTCFKIEFAYRPGRKTASSELCSALGDSVKIAACVQGRCDGSGMTDDEKKTCERAQGATEQCGDWVVTEPQVPEGAPGICNKTFAGVVHKYIEEKAKVNQTLKQSGLDLCSSNSEIDKRGAESIEACIDFAKAKFNYGDETVLTVDQLGDCKFGARTDSLEYNHAVNYWNRGPTRQETGAYVPAVNFGNEVLGVDFVGSVADAGLYTRTIDSSHALVRGYAGRAFLGNSQLAIVSADNYRIRTRVVMNVEDAVTGRLYPAILVSNPRGPLIGGNGLVVFYAFPPEIGRLGGQDTPEGAGSNLINNMIDFLIS